MLKTLRPAITNTGPSVWSTILCCSLLKGNFVVEDWESMMLVYFVGARLSKHHKKKSVRSFDVYVEVLDYLCYKQEKFTDYRERFPFLV